MLVLTRKRGETIVVDGNIRITVVGAKGKAVRLGIEAPREIPIWRSEHEQARAGSLDSTGVVPPSARRTLSGVGSLRHFG